MRDSQTPGEEALFKGRGASFKVSYKLPHITSRVWISEFIEWFRSVLNGSRFSWAGMDAGAGKSGPRLVMVQDCYHFKWTATEMMIIIGVIAVVAKAHERLHQSRRDCSFMQGRERKEEKPNNYDNNGEWLLKGTRCNINYNQCETHSHACGCIYSDMHAETHTHIVLLTCLARPFSQVASYLLPFGKCSTPLPWNIPSFISPSYLVSVGKVYSPFPSILR